MSSWRPLPGIKASQTPVPEQLGQVRGLFWITTSSFPFHTAVVTPALVLREEDWLELSEKLWGPPGQQRLNCHLCVWLLTGWFKD